MNPNSLPNVFDTQQQAASLLGIDVYDLKQWKAEGCQAFKHGRVYRVELLEWMAQNNKKRVRGSSSEDLGESKNGLRAALEAILALAKRYDEGLLTRDQYFDMVTPIVEASNHKAFLQTWRELNFFYIAEFFPEPADAWKAHPKIMRWFEAQANVRISKKRSRKRSGG
jgi:hypothetical protein